MSLCLTHPPTSLTSRPFQNRRAARFTSIEPLCPVIHKCGVGPCTHAALKSRFATRRPSGHRNSEKKRSNVQALRKDVCDRTGVSRTLRTACQGGPGSGLNLKTEPSAAMTLAAGARTRLRTAMIPSISTLLMQLLKPVMMKTTS